MAKKQVDQKQQQPPLDLWVSQSGQVTGFETITKEDLGIPFIDIIQKGSAEYDRDHENYLQKRIEGAQVGAIFNTLTRQILHLPDEEPVSVIPIAFHKAFVEWRPRTAGGGIVQSHTDPAILLQCTRNDKNQDVLPNGNTIVTSYYMMVLLTDNLPDILNAQAIMVFRSTQIKKCRQWLNRAMQIRHPKTGMPMPLYSHKYDISTVGEKNNKGSWRGWKIELGEMVVDPALAKILIAEATQHREERVHALTQSIVAGAVSVQDDGEEPY